MLGIMPARNTRDFNRRLVLQAIRVNERIARADIARLTGLTAPAVSNIVSDLITDGFVQEIGRATGRAGQPAIELSINADGACTVGLHLDHDGCTGVMVDLSGRVLAVQERPMPAPSPETALAALSGLFHALVAETGVPASRLLGIGLVTFGPIDSAYGVVRRPPLTSGWDAVPLRRQLSNAVGYPVYFDNNATAAASAEHWYGIGRTYRDFLYVSFGHGLGGGVFADGQLHRGAARNAGELGHVIVEPDGLPCGCGAHGCLETRASLFALKRDLGEEWADMDKLAAAVVEGEPQVMAWLDGAAGWLAQAVVSAANLLDTQAVIFGGRPPEPVLQVVAQRTEAHARSRFLRGDATGPRFLVGQSGARVPALGAAILPIYDAFALASAPRVAMPSDNKTPLRRLARRRRRTPGAGSAASGIRAR